MTRNPSNRLYWYHANGDGTADRYEDSPAICARIDAGELGWFTTPEGAIRHGGVIATAFELKTEKYINAAAWLATNGREQIVLGEKVILTITERVNDL